MSGVVMPDTFLLEGYELSGKITIFAIAMKKTERHIVYLLNEKGFVEIPGFGVLTMSHIPAAFDGEKLIAPAAGVTFNDSIISHDDHLLVSSIARRDSSDIDLAADVLAQDILAIKNDISQDGKSVVGNIGYFFNNEGNIDFAPSAELQMPGCYYPEIKLSPISRNSHNKKQLPSYADTDEKREEFFRSLRRTASSAAAIAIIAILAFVFTQFPVLQSFTRHASLVEDKNTRTELSYAANPTATSDASLVLVFNTPADASCDVEVADTNVEEAIENNSESLVVVDENKESKIARYCLVVASLASEAEAYKFIEYTDASLNLLVKDGRFRVYVMEGETYEGLLRDAKAAGIYEKYPSAWICKK